MKRMRLATVLFGLLAMLIPALCEAAGVAVTLNTKVGPPKQQLIVGGSDFNANEAVDVYFDTTDLALAVTDLAGKFSIKIKVPVSALPGDHWVTAIGRKSGLAGQRSFKVRANWPQFRNVVRHSGYNPTENVINANNACELNLVWVVATGHPIDISSPAVAGGIVYVGSWGAKLYAFDATTGVYRWDSGETITGDIDSSPAVANGKVYVGSYDAKLYAFNATTGLKLWDSGDTISDAIVSSPAVANGVVYVGSYDGKLYAFNAASGAKLWDSGDAVTDVISSSPAVAKGVVYVGSQDNNLYAFDTADGSLLWAAATAGSVKSSPTVVNGVVYVGSYDGNLYAYARDGEVPTLMEGSFRPPERAGLEPDYRLKPQYSLR